MASHVILAAAFVLAVVFAFGPVDRPPGLSREARRRIGRIKRGL